MKDFIYINYGLKINKIYNNYFFIGNEKIIIYETNKEEKDIIKLFNLTNLMYRDGLMINTFLINKNNECFTYKNNKKIILFKVNDRDIEVTYNYLNKYIKYNIDLEEFDIINKWKERIDNIENILVEFNKEYLLIQDSINYFIGCSENAITLMNEYEYISNNNISHNISFKDYNLDSFNNPFSIIKTNRLYDIAHYIKFKLYNKEIDYEEVYYILKGIDNEFDQVYFFSCLLFRDFYFDIVDEIINGRKDEKELNVFIDNIKSYEELLSFCKRNLKKCKYLSLINWF